LQLLKQPRLYRRVDDEYYSRLLQKLMHFIWNVFTPAYVLV